MSAQPNTDESTRFLQQVSGTPDSGAAKIIYTSGAESADLKAAHFFMKMQDEGKSVEEARAYANIGPMIGPDINWDEVKRILSTFQ